MESSTNAETCHPDHRKRWLSDPFETLVNAAANNPQLTYDVVIVGSGYGGAMAAATLAKGEIPKDGNVPARPIKMCVLERGEEYLPGSFPSQMADLANHVRVSTPSQPAGLGRPEGLFDLRVGPDACALVANGLGGGSLINGAVMLERNFTTFDSKMSKAVEAELSAEDGFLDRAKVKLGATRQRQQRPDVRPDERPEKRTSWENNTINLHPHVSNNPLAKTTLLKSISPKQFQSVALTIEMRGGHNASGVKLEACSLCGDCMTGCNVGARESLDTNLLLDARQQGAEIYTGASVMRIKRDETQTLWILEVVYTNRKLREREKMPLFLRTQKLILAAGTLGSTEILLRSKSPFLHFSERLGMQFSCNGDNLAAIYKAKAAAHSVADEGKPLRYPPNTATNDSLPRRIGPTITGMLNVLGDASGPGFVVQEFATPAPLIALFEELLTTTNLLHALPDGDWSPHAPDALKTDPLAVDDDAIEHSVVLGLIGHDAADGQLRLAGTGPRDLIPPLDKKVTYEGHLHIDWPSASKGKAIEDAFKKLKDMAKPVLSEIDGKLLPNPLWSPLPSKLEDLVDGVKGPVLTVHPLGGCPMGESPATGVVNSYGMVYEGEPEAKPFQKKNPVHAVSPSWQASLLVLDGSIIPGSLGANPSLTIAALSLRASEHWQRVWGWQRVDTTAQPATSQGPVVLPRPIARLPEECTVSAPKTETQLQIIERLHGEIGSGLYAELTFGFKSCTIKQLTQPMQRRLHTDATLRAELPTVNRLRVYRTDDWTHLSLNVADDATREQHAVIAAQLEGHLDLLEREASNAIARTARAGWAYLQNRGWRDVVRGLRNSTADTAYSAWWDKFKLSLNVASKAGEARCFNYVMKVTHVDKAIATSEINTSDWQGLVKVGDAVEGIKRFTYVRRSNPWNQLLYLTLTKFPLAGVGLGGQLPQLKLDARFLASQGVPLARITAQQNQPAALADLAQFGMYGARLFLNTHLWSFRKPDAPNPEAPQRLPGAVDRLPPPEIREIELKYQHSECKIPVRVRLTRYAKRDSKLPPLVMIHGFSASGTTFAHPALSPSMALYFWNAGRDIWILDLRTSPGMPTAKYPWTFEDVAWADIPVAIDHIARQVTSERGLTQALQVDVFAHCVGAVMLSMALLTNTTALAFRPYRPFVYQRELDSLPSHIHRVVLSQKSFALSYSDANMLRAYLMRYLRRVVLPESYKFRPSPFPTLRDKVMDLFLAALPYPIEEFDRENPSFWHALKRTPWQTTRHRMDALYEHTFNVNNMSDEVLEAIDDQFGPINTETIAQIIHFARHQVITTRQGRNIFVSLDNLKRWPKGGTLGLYAAENRMVDKKTLELTAQWMQMAGIPYTPQSIAGAAHQDVLIGQKAEETFKAVNTFLLSAVVTTPNLQQIQQIQQIQAVNIPQLNVPPRLEKPWFGPRLSTSKMGVLELLVGAHPGYAQSVAVLIPVLRENGTFRPLVNKANEYHGVPIYPRPGKFVLKVTRMLSPIELHLASGVLALVYYPGSAPSSAMNGQGDLNRPPRQVQIPSSLILTALASYAANHAEALECAYVDAEAWQASKRLSHRTFAFASCQYPSGVLDTSLAQRSYARLNALVQPRNTHSPEELLLIGDQIYADATAGLLDPAREDDRYQRPYEDLFQIPGLQSLLRKIPVRMMLDDHEIVDNWEPGFSKLDMQWRKEGLRAYRQYQRTDAHYRQFWVEKTICGFPLFMADSRSERQFRKATQRSAHIMSDRQSRALQKWLLRVSNSSDPSSPKFISCASMVLPRHTGQPKGLNETPNGQLGLDDWDAYPESLNELLGFIAHHEIKGVVFISGDAHLANVTEVTLGAVKVASIHAPALYAPFPFANAQPSDYASNEVFTTSYTDDFGITTYEGIVKSRFPTVGDGFVLMTPHCTDGAWKIDIKIYSNAAEPWSGQVCLS